MTSLYKFQSIVQKSFLCSPDIRDVLLLICLSRVVVWPEVDAFVAQDSLDVNPIAQC